jgi:hypothetical protein
MITTANQPAQGMNRDIARYGMPVQPEWMQRFKENTDTGSVVIHSRKFLILLATEQEMA